jgi:hypothetical protein
MTKWVIFQEYIVPVYQNNLKFLWYGCGEKYVVVWIYGILWAKFSYYSNYFLITK